MRLIFISAFFAISAFAVEQPTKEMQQVGLSTVLGTQINLDLVFTNEAGKEVSLKQLSKNSKPLIIVPVYYKCPRLCGLVMDGVVNLVKDLSLKLNQDYQIASVSFNPKESFDLAEAKKNLFKDKLSASDINGWHFLVGSDKNVSELMQQLGFNFKPDGEDFAHTAAIFIISANGKLSQYFSGIEYSARNTRLALVEASEGLVGNIADRVVLYCFRFDPTKGKYIPMAFNIMRLGGAITLFLLVGLIFTLVWREKKIRHV